MELTKAKEKFSVMKKYTFLLLSCLLVVSMTTLSAQQWDGPDNTVNSIYRTGRVGIGVTSPLQSLHLSGNLRLEGTTILFGNNLRLTKNGTTGLGLRSDHPSNSQLVLRDSLNQALGRLIGYRTTIGDIMALRDSENKNFVMNYNTANYKFTSLLVNNKSILSARLYDEGTPEETRRVGVGTSSPRRNLDVRGSAIVDHLYVGTNSAGGFDTDEYKMFVDGKAAFEEVRVQLSQNWGDYVFAPEYELRSLADLRAYIEAYGHLPNIPSAAEMEDGMEVSDIVHRQMVTIEELTLYTLQQQKEIDELKAQVQELMKVVKATAEK